MAESLTTDTSAFDEACLSGVNCMMAGNLKVAEAEFQQALDGYISLLGPYYVYTLGARYNLT